VSPETKAALRQASYQLVTEAGFAAQSAADCRADWQAHEKRAQGFREAAAVIDATLAEDEA
jgi:hypothetical protein